MKIVFTGGGTGGHFYPIIAVAQEVNKIADERNLLQPSLFFISNTPYDHKILFENEITFKKASAGKIRRYFSPKNFFDVFKTGWGIVSATIQLFTIYPDVVFSKGGYASFPTTVAARILRIPVFIHESDATPGRANLWASKFAYRVAISYPSAAKFFSDAVFTGTPVRKEIVNPAREGGYEFLQLSKDIPTILIMGGSQGAKAINEVVLTALPDLLKKYQIIHQTGTKNIDEIQKTSNIILEGHPYKNRYKPFGYLNNLAMRMSAGIADIVISRAGSTSIFEISSWEKPSIIIPIPEDISHDQRKNAFAYAREGAASVLEQNNLTPHLLESEIDRILGDNKLQEQMIEGAKKFKRPNAARMIAEELVKVALEHES